LYRAGEGLTAAFAPLMMLLSNFIKASVMGRIKSLAWASDYGRIEFTGDGEN